MPGYRRSIFKTVIVGLLIASGGGTIAAIFRHFGGVFRGTNITRKRFYTFLNSAKIPWQFIHRRVADLISDWVAVAAGRLLVVLDDTTYGKTGKNVSGCDVHFDHAAKTNTSRWIFGHYQQRPVLDAEGDQRKEARQTLQVRQAVAFLNPPVRPSSA